MRSVRVKPIPGTAALLVTIVCDCGNNVLINESANDTSFSHPAKIGYRAEDFYLHCGVCRKRYLVHPQYDHVHVSDAGTYTAGSAADISHPNGWGHGI